MRFHSDPIEEHPEVPLADEGRLEAVVEHWSDKRDKTSKPAGAANHAYVVSAGDWRSEVQREAQLAEILGLVDAFGDTVVGHESLRVTHTHPRTFFGSGTSEAFAERARAAGADLLVVDVALSPSQTRNLEDLVGMAVQDREGVILGVFHKHARTRAARIQVEIAQLEYLRPRIRGLGLDMDQQAGGVMQGKGAGETASELMARRLDDRLATLRRTFEGLSDAAERQRQQRHTCERIALVGYTNAGKTSLMNALTDAGLSSRDRPFETLDTTSRSLSRHGGDVLIGDTVGFIRDLPPRLMDSFASTLAEVREATLLALVVDLSDPEWELHLAITEGMLEHLDAQAVPRFYAFNKADLVDEVPHQSLRAVAGDHPHAVLSSLDADATAQLRSDLLQTVRQHHRTATLFVPYARSDIQAQVHAGCRVLDAEALDDGMRFTAQAPEATIARIVHALEGRQA